MSSDDTQQPVALSAGEVAELAERILAARREGRTLPAASATRPLRLEDAYRVQARMSAARLAAGEHPAGWKLGYTSRVMRAQMGVDAPNYGPLTDAMLLADDAAVPGSALQPRVEPEVALVLGPAADDLAALSAEAGGRPPLGAVAAAVAEARAAIEVVDSVWTGYRFTLEDNTADSSSAAWVVLGPVLPVPAAALDQVAVSLEAEGSPVLTGSGADADGHPLNALGWLAAQLHSRGARLRAGDVVITGGLTRAVALDRPVRAVFRPAAGPAVTVRVRPPSGPRRAPTAS